jgi:hypothetical protein
MAKKKMKIDPKEAKKMRDKARRASIKQNYEDDHTEATRDGKKKPATKKPAKKKKK